MNDHGTDPLATVFLNVIYMCAYMHIYCLHGCSGRAYSCNSYKRKRMYIQRAYSVGLFQFVLDLRKEPRAGERRTTYRRPWVSPLVLHRHDRLKGPVCKIFTLLIWICFYDVPLNLRSLHASCGVGAKVMQCRPGLLQTHSGNNKRNDYRQMQTQYNIYFLVCFYVAEKFCFVTWWLKTHQSALKGNRPRPLHSQHFRAMLSVMSSHAPYASMRPN